MRLIEKKEDKYVGDPILDRFQQEQVQRPADQRSISSSSQSMHSAPDKEVLPRKGSKNGDNNS